MLSSDYDKLEKAEVPPTMDFAERDEIVSRLREAVEQAKSAYAIAQKEHALAMERRKDLGASHPDGSIVHATRTFNYTLERYRQALWRYNRYLLDGELPDEQSPSGPGAR